MNWWHDPQRGCGTLEGWQRTQRITDLPGCDGELPKGAPPGEVAMHDAKKALREAEKILDAGQTAEVESRLDAATNTMNKAPNDPRVNWARPHYQTALNLLRKRLSIIPRLGKLRTAYKAAMDAADVASKQKTDAARKSAASAADTCVSAFREAEGQGVDLSLPVELNSGRVRPLRDDLRDCSSGRSDPTAAPAPGGDGKTPPPAPAVEDPGKKDPGEVKGGGEGAPKETPKPPEAKGGGDGGVPRAKWLKALKGDRKKVFQEHADAFPSFDGEPGPKGAAKAAEWRYGDQVVRFKKNKLVKPKGEK